jgi:cytochrome c-type biogenesis protein CcmF
LIPEIGQFALILALLLALTTGVLPMLGAHRGIEGWRSRSVALRGRS